MTSSNSPRWIIIVGLGVIILTSVFYISYFGLNLSPNHSAWAEFGSFFGGFLSPLLALLAIVMLYHTLARQISEFKASVMHLSETSKVAADDLELTKRQTLDNETLAVLAKAELQIAKLLDCVVSESGTQPEIKIFHMCLEARRSVNPLERSDSYSHFIEMARTEGAVVWSYMFSLHEVVVSMVAILKDYSCRHSARFSPIILYYHNRLLAVVTLLFDTEFLSDEMRIEIVTMADLHG